MNCAHPGCLNEGTVPVEIAHGYHVQFSYLCVRHFGEQAEACLNQQQSVGQQFVETLRELADIHREAHAIRDHLLEESNMLPPTLFKQSRPPNMGTTEPQPAPISERTVNHLIALVVALVAAIGAHAAGKPWWVDHPFGGDAYDVAFMTFLVMRGFLWLFGEDK